MARKPGTATITAKALANDSVETSIDITVDDITLSTPIFKKPTIYNTGKTVGLSWSTAKTNSSGRVVYDLLKIDDRDALSFGSFDYSVISSGSSSSQYTDTNVSLGGAYYYKVIAYVIDRETGAKLKEAASISKYVEMPEYSGGSGSSSDYSRDGYETDNSVSGITIQPAEITLGGGMNVSENNLIIANLMPVNCAADVSWHSENESVFKPYVQSDSTKIQFSTGNVTRPTQVNLTAQAGGKEGTASVTVYDNPSIKVGNSAVNRGSFIDYDIRKGNMNISWTTGQSTDLQQAYTAVYTERPDLTADGTGNEPGRLSINYNHYYTGGTNFTIPVDALTVGNYIKVAVCSYGCSWTTVGIHIVDSFIPMQKVTISGNNTLSMTVGDPAITLLARKHPACRTGE